MEGESSRRKSKWKNMGSRRGKWKRTVGGSGRKAEVESERGK
jgi:hypothetical protein